MLDIIITFFVLGVIFGAIYDFFRFFRLLFKNKIVWFVIDFIYMIIISLLFFINLLAFNNGMVRYYFIILPFLGFLLYIATIFRLTLKIEKPVSLIIRKSFKKVLQFIKKVYYNLFVKNKKKEERANESTVAEIVE